MNQKIVVVAIIVIVLFVGGIWFATLLPDQQAAEQSPISNTVVKIPLFTDLRLGTPVRASFAPQNATFVNLRRKGSSEKT